MVVNILFSKASFFLAVGNFKATSLKAKLKILETKC